MNKRTETTAEHLVAGQHFWLHKKFYLACRVVPTNVGITVITGGSTLLLRVDTPIIIREA